MTAVQVGDLEVFVAAVLALLCVVAYQLATGGGWRDSGDGWHVMSFMAALAAALALAGARLIAVDVFHVPDPPWFFNVRIVVFLAVPGVLAWRLVMILIAWREKRRRAAQIKARLAALSADEPRPGGQK
jgi:peptidoglycan/LPS O-acetylase OafA/YrhL